MRTMRRCAQPKSAFSRRVSYLEFGKTAKAIIIIYSIKICLEHSHRNGSGLGTM